MNTVKRYQVTWHWRKDTPSADLRMDFVEATDAQQALTKVKRTLRAESKQAGVLREFVALEVVYLGTPRQGTA